MFTSHLMVCLVETLSSHEFWTFFQVRKRFHLLSFGEHLHDYHMGRKKLQIYGGPRCCHLVAAGAQQGGRIFVFRKWLLVLFIPSFNAKSMDGMGAVPVVLPGGTASPREMANKPPSQPVARYPSGYKRWEFEPLWAKKGNLQII